MSLRETTASSSASSQSSSRAGSQPIEVSRLPGVSVALGCGRDVTNDDGRFEIVRAEPGDLLLSRAAWQDASVSWDGVESEIDTTMEPVEVNGIRVGGVAAGDPEHWQSLLDLADSTGINAFVVDIKDEYGTVYHDTEVERAHEASAVTLQYVLDAVVADMDEHNIYKIARVVAFQDTPMATIEPDHAVLNAGGADLWRTRNGDAWMDPTDPVSFEYPVALAEEACLAGFDEIQFDFASFPFGGDVSTAVFDDEYTEEVRVGSILAFLKRAYSVLSPRCAVGANVLGITLESGSDEGVGQRPGLMSRSIDVLSPMLYSTNYGPGWKGYDDPNDHASEIVDSALVSGNTRLEGYAYYRPWIQTWTVPEARGPGDPASCRRPCERVDALVEQRLVSDRTASTPMNRAEALARADGRSHRVPPMPTVGGVARAGRRREACAVRRRGVLGAARAGIRGSRGARRRCGSCSGRARCEPDGEDVHRRSQRRLALPRDVAGRIRQPSGVDHPR